jgi:enterobacterial common antigen flippase
MSGWRDIVEIGAVRAFSVITNVVVLFATAHSLGPDGRGVLVAATTWILLVAVMTGLSLGQVSHRQFQLRRDPVSNQELAGTLLAVAVVGTVVAYGLIWAIARGGGNGVFSGVPAPVLLLCGLMLPFLVLDEYARNLLAALGRSRHYSIAQVVGGVLRLVTVLAALGPLDLGVKSVIVCLVLSQAVTAGIEYHAVWDACGRQFHYSRRQLRSLLSGASRLHPNTIASFLLVQANVLLLSRYGTAADVAQYQLALQLVLALVLLPQAGAMLLFGKVASMGADAAWVVTRRISVQVLAGTGLCALILAMLAPVIVETLAGPGFADSVLICRWLLVALVGMSLAELMAPQWLGRGLFLVSTLLTLVNAIGSIAINAYLIRRYGAIGAAWGTAAAYTLFALAGQLAFVSWCEARHRRLQDA